MSIVLGFYLNEIPEGLGISVKDDSFEDLGVVQSLNKLLAIQQFAVLFKSYSAILDSDANSFTCVTDTGRQFLLPKARFQIFTVKGFPAKLGVMGVKIAEIGSGSESILWEYKENELVALHLSNDRLETINNFWNTLILQNQCWQEAKLLLTGV